MNPEELPLRDIHLPGAPGFWPPAPGWWLLLLAALLVAGAAFAYRAWRARTRLKRVALAELDRLDEALARSGDPRAVAAEVSALLRRIVLSLYPRSEVAAVTGQAWIELLRQAAPEASRALSGPLEHELLAGPYRRGGAEDTQRLVAAARRWVLALRAQEMRA